MPPDPSVAVPEQVQEALGRPPRSFAKSLLRRYLLPPVPRWARQGPYVRYHEHRRLLLERGRVVWAHLVQANSLLFEAGDEDCPGVVVYSLVGNPSPTAAELRDIAHRIFELRRRPAEDAAARRLGEALDDEHINFFGDRVPESISPRHHCQISTIFFHRSHFPAPVLARQAFPILVSPEAEGSVMMVPSRYWPRELASLWESASVDSKPKRSLIRNASVWLLAPLLLKAVLLAAFFLLFLPSTWRYVTQGDPIPVDGVAQVGELPNHSVIEASLGLKAEPVIETKHTRYLEVTGSDGRIWFATGRTRALPGDELVREVCQLQQAGWSDASLRDALAAKELDGAWPVTILRSTAPPTLRSKLWRVTLALVAALVLFGAYRFVRGWFRQP